MIKRIIFLPLLLLFAKSVSAQEMVMSAEQVMDKIRSGLLGQVAIGQGSAQAAQFFCSMIAETFIEGDIRQIVQGGVDVLDETE